MFIKWKYKPEGFCPVQAEGWFMGYYFYFRSRYETATIDFAHSETDWETGKEIVSYKLCKTDAFEAGWLDKKKCERLIWWGCLKFMFKRKKQ